MTKYTGFKHIESPGVSLYHQKDNFLPSQMTAFQSIVLDFMMVAVVFTPERQQVFRAFINHFQLLQWVDS